MTETATLTVHLVRSFAYRNEKLIVLKQVDLNHSVGQLKALINAHIQSTPGLAPYRNKHMDTLQLYHQAHGFKSQCLMVDISDKAVYLADEHAKLRDCGVQNETELSYYNHAEYEEFRKNPEVKWE